MVALYLELAHQICPTSIASNINKIINKKDLDYFYRVYNAGTRGSFSYQEFIKYLNDIKKEINPDIVIVLNGRNDVYLASKGFLQENFDTEYSLILKSLLKKINLMILSIK